MRRTIYTSILWNLFEVIIRNGFSFIVQLILAIILIPEYFGLVGMATVFTGVIRTATELGFGSALIQKKEEDLEEVHYHTAFWATLIINIIVLIIIILFLGQLISKFYKEEALYLIVVVLSIQFIFKPLTLIHRIKLTRQMNFRNIAIVETITSIISGIASIALALMETQYWSIVIYYVLPSIVSFPLMLKAYSWKPKLTFSKKALKEIFGYGFYSMINEMAVYFSKNVIDYLLIGKLLGSKMLGIYTLAFILTDTFRYKIMSILNKVMFPVYGKNQKNIDAVGKYYLSIIKYNCMVIFPIMAIIFCLAESIIINIFGAQWGSAIIPLKILSISVVIYCTIATAATVLKGIGKVKEIFYIDLFRIVFITIPAIFIGIKLAGVNGASAAILIDKLFSVFIMSYFMKKYINVSLKKIAKKIYPFFIGFFSIILLYRVLPVFILKNQLILLIIHIILLLLCYFVAILPFTYKEFKILLKEFKR